MYIMQVQENRPAFLLLSLLLVTVLLGSKVVCSQMVTGTASRNGIGLLQSDWAPRKSP